MSVTIIRKITDLSTEVEISGTVNSDGDVEDFTVCFTKNGQDISKLLPLREVREFQELIIYAANERALSMRNGEDEK